MYHVQYPPFWFEALVVLCITQVILQPVLIPVSGSNMKTKPIYVGRGQGFAPLALGPIRPTISDIVKDVLEFKNDSQCSDDPCLSIAMRKVAEKFQLANKVKMIHLNDVFKLELDIWSESPGIPWKFCGYKTKGDIKRDPGAIQSVRRFWYMVKIGKKVKPPDCMAYAKAHITEIGKKEVRAVWTYPATMTFGECMFAKPLIDAYKKVPEHFQCIAYSFERANGEMKKLYERFSGDYFYGAVAFKNFDKLVPKWLICYAFLVLAQNIDFSRYQDYGVADRRKNLSMYLFIQEYFINTTIRICNGDRYRKKGGIPSGSYFTHLVGSVCNAVLIYWACMKLHGKFPIDSIFMGGYSLISTVKLLDLSQVKNLMKSIGMDVNDEKSQINRDMISIKFLT